MEKNQINIYEAMPMLRNVLNLSGFAKSIGKTNSWFNNKEQKLEFPRVIPGFSQANVDLINYHLERAAEFCEKHVLHLPKNSEREIYNKYVKAELKDLRKIISLVYLRENYTKIPKNSWGKKLVNVANRSAVAQFTEEDIKQINEGIIAIAKLLHSIHLTV